MLTIKKVLPLTLVTLLACYPKINVTGFDENQWNADLTCNQDRYDMGQLLVENQATILGKGQAEIKQLLGQPQEHELYNRNQKFFFYDLTTRDSCQNIKILYRLSVKFDAIDRAKELVIIE